MNKTEFVAKYAEINKVTKISSAEEVDRFIKAMYQMIATGRSVMLTGFGKFDIYQVPERRGVYNMGEHKGEAYVSPAHFKVVFKPCESLEDDIYKLEAEDE